MVKLRRKHRMAGVGIYWALVEMLYEEGGKLSLTDVEDIAEDLKEKVTIVDSVIKNFDLFKMDETHFWSESANERMELRNQKSQKATESALKRWGKLNGNATSNATDMRTHSDGNAIKERKGKEIKEKEEKEIIGNEVENYKPVIIPEMIKEFKNRFPSYPIDEQKDFPACLQIAYKIGQMHSWNKDSVVNGKKGEVARRWGEILDFVVKDKWYSTRAIYDLNNEWQRLIQSYQVNNPLNSNTRSGPPLKSL